MQINLCFIHLFTLYSLWSDQTLPCSLNKFSKPQTRTNFCVQSKVNSQLNWPGPSCSKQTISLINVLLKFQCKYLKYRYANIFCWKNVRSFCIAKASLIFSTKNFGVFGYKVVKHLTKGPLNKLVKLTMLWTNDALNNRAQGSNFGVVCCICYAVD